MSRATVYPHTFLVPVTSPLDPTASRKAALREAAPPEPTLTVSPVRAALGLTAGLVAFALLARLATVGSAAPAAARHAAGGGPLGGPSLPPVIPAARPTAKSAPAVATPQRGSAPQRGTVPVATPRWAQNAPAGGTTPNTPVSDAAAATDAALAQPGRNGSMVRVGLSTQGAPLRFWCAQPMALYDPQAPAHWLHLPANSSLSVTFVGNGASGNADGKAVPLSVQVEGAPSSFKNPLSASQMVVIRAENGGEPLRVTSDGSTPRWGRRYRGSLEVAPLTFTFDPPVHKGPLRLVNVVGMEDYLKGVVPWEMSPSAPIEALKAQAICARSGALSQIASHRFGADGYDVCDYDRSQGYRGVEQESPTTSRAVEETKGLAVYANGQVAEVVYGTNSGGVTASSGDVWKGQQPYLWSVPDFSAREHPQTAALWPPRSETGWTRFCEEAWPSWARPSEAQRRELAHKRATNARTAQLYGPDDWPEFYRWTRTISAEDMNRAFAAKGIAQVTDVQVFERAPSGHIKCLRVRGTSSKAASTPDQPVEPEGTLAPARIFDSKVSFALPASEGFSELRGDGVIRAMFSGRLGSTSALPSSLFVVLPQRDATGRVTSWVFKGAGWGHGVGMCQRGAQNHALAGWTARQIINFYYRGVEIRRVS